MINIRKAQLAGHDALANARAEKSVATAGHPRVGSAGCVAEDGNVYGICPRIALARQLGIEETPGLHTRIMWKAGEHNENAWNEVLDAGIPPDLTRQTAEISFRIDDVPLPVLGHPDVVYADANGPRYGLELKGVYGYTTAVLVALEGRPKNENLIQAAAYSHFMSKMDWALCYTSAAYVKLNHWDHKEHGVKSIVPFYRTFYLVWDDDELLYRDEQSDELMSTVVTGKGIEDYYRLVEEMKASKDLGPRPSSHYVCGKQNKWGRESMCGLCPFKAACDKYDGDKNFDVWIANITTVTEGEAA